MAACLKNYIITVLYNIFEEVKQGQCNSFEGMTCGAIFQSPLFYVKNSTSRPSLIIYAIKYIVVL